MSCSPMKTSASVAKPCSNGRIARPVAGFGNLASAVAVGDPPQVAEAALAQHRPETVGRAFAIGGDRGPAAGLLLGGEVVAHRFEQVDPGIGALGGEILRRPRAGVERIGLFFSDRKRRELHDGAATQPGLPFRFVEKHLLAAAPAGKAARCRAGRR